MCSSPWGGARVAPIAAAAAADAPAELNAPRTAAAELPAPPLSKLAHSEGGPCTRTKAQRSVRASLLWTRKCRSCRRWRESSCRGSAFFYQLVKKIHPKKQFVNAARRIEGSTHVHHARVRKRTLALFYFDGTLEPQHIYVTPFLPCTTQHANTR